MLSALETAAAVRSGETTALEQVEGAMAKLLAEKVESERL